MPPRPAGARPEPDYSEPGALERIADDAGLTPERAFDVAWAYEFPDEATLRRALVAPAGIASLVGASREEELKDGIVRGLPPSRGRRELPAQERVSVPDR